MTGSALAVLDVGLRSIIIIKRGGGLEEERHPGRCAFEAGGFIECSFFN